MHFTKLFSTITDSSVWSEDKDTKIVWITMLAMADQHGRIHASLPGLARRSVVTLEEAERAVTKLLAPDPYSRTKEHEGRRIVEIDGGWQLLNHGKYRALLSDEETKRRKREWWQKNRGKDAARQELDNTSQPLDVSTPKLDANSMPSTQVEAEAEAEVEVEASSSGGAGGHGAVDTNRDREPGVRPKPRVDYLAQLTAEQWAPGETGLAYARELGLTDTEVEERIVWTRNAQAQFRRGRTVDWWDVRFFDAVEKKSKWKTDDAAKAQSAPRDRVVEYRDL